jgi:hypothetical protein
MVSNTTKVEGSETSVKYPMSIFESGTFTLILNFSLFVASIALLTGAKATIEAPDTGPPFRHKTVGELGGNGEVEVLIKTDPVVPTLLQQAGKRVVEASKFSMNCATPVHLVENISGPIQAPRFVSSHIDLTQILYEVAGLKPFIVTVV